MASTDAQRARRRAQRETARRVRNRETILPRAIRAPQRQAQEAYGRRVDSGQESAPAKGSPESKVLARLAGWSRWGKADPRFEAAFKQYWYHDEKKPDGPDEDDEDFDDENDEDEDEL